MLYRLTCAMLALLLWTAPAEAETLTVAAPDLPPYGFEQDGRPVGLALDIASAVAVEAGFTAVKVLVPADRLLDRVADGEADLAMLAAGHDADKHGRDLGEVMEIETVVFGLAGAPYRRLRDLRGKTVARPHKSAYTVAISRRHGFVPFPATSSTRCLTLLVSGQADAVAGTGPGLGFAAAALGIPAQALGPRLTLGTVATRLYLSAATASPERTRRLRQALETLRTNNTLDAIIANYSR